MALLSLPDPPLRDEAVVLRPWREEDIPAIVAACRDPLIPRFTYVPSPYGEDDARAWVADLPARRDRGEHLGLAIADAGSGALLGSVGLRMSDWAQPRAGIGYWVAPEARGRGVATRAVRLLSRWALDTLHLGRLELLTHLENVASQRVAERAGFRREGVLRAYLEMPDGTWRDCVMFSMVAGDSVREAN